jgi:glycerol-3-phosphate dehydrogenase (NAD(P)+)
VKISVLGAGAFGTALAIALANSETQTILWSRSAETANAMDETRENTSRLPGFQIPRTVLVTSDMAEAAKSDVLLVAVPTQTLATLLDQYGHLFYRSFVIACCKGIDLASGEGPAEVIAKFCPDATPGVLTGPSFAVDIAAGQPTALILATEGDTDGRLLQHSLSRPALRIYRTDDVKGAELGGALKNVIAIAAGLTIGAGLGESARAAVITRGFAEMVRYGLTHGAKPETLSGLSGMGDLMLTCSSDKSRNFSAGLALGRGEELPANVTIEGLASARAIASLAKLLEIEMPIAAVVDDVASGRLTVEAAAKDLLSRPLKKE